MKPVAKIVGADEYGPIIEWSTHWADLKGAELCVATADAAGHEMKSPTPSQISQAAGEPSSADIYVWFAENKGSELDGERFIRAWTADVERVPGLRKAIGKEPTRYRSTAPTTATAPVLRCACGNIAETRNAHVDALRCKSCWARFAALASPAASALTDEQRSQIAYIAAYDPDELEKKSKMALVGWGRSVINRARALLAASIGGDRT